MNGRREFSILLLVLPRQMVADIRAQAKRQGVSTVTLLRTIVKEYLRTVRGRQTIYVNLNEPVVYMTPQEIQYADEVMRIFREEDR
jgi:hypothetical protein